MMMMMVMMTMRSSIANHVVVVSETRHNPVACISTCVLPSAHCALPAAHCPLLIAHCPAPTAHCPFPTAVRSRMSWNTNFCTHRMLVLVGLEVARAGSQARSCQGLGLSLVSFKTHIEVHLCV